MFTGNYIINNTYQILGAINKGGIGTIYKAVHLRLNKYVVLKRLDNDFAKRLNRRAEADILKRLNHEYLPQVYDFIEENGQVFTVIDYIDGKPLSFYINNQYAISQKQIIIWAKQLCEALVYLHSQNPPILHRDIKPDNIMIRNDGRVCLIDFNISMCDSESGMLSSGLSLGYSSPEQFYFSLLNSSNRSLKISDYVMSELGQSQILRNAISSDRLNLNSDIYSLGATLYHTMFGIKPAMSITTPLEFPESHYEYSEALLNIIKKSVSTNPDKRYKNAQDMLDALRNSYKIDRRYTRYRMSKNISLIVCVIILVIGGLLSYLGVNQIQKEKDDKYAEIIYTAQAYADNQDYTKSIEEFDKAIELCNDKVVAYAGKLNSYYENMEYDQAISYAKLIFNTSAVEQNMLQNTEQYAEIYYIFADCYFNKEDYQNAAINFKRATEIVVDNPTYYRDYAISMAQLKKIDEAQSILEQAEAYNITSDSSALVQAEIKLAKNEYENSVDYFNQAINTTKDNTLKKRAYILCSQVFKKTNQIDNEINILENAYKDLSAVSPYEVTVYLGDAYSRKATITPNESYKWYSKAIYCYRTLYDKGRASLNVKLNLSSLYEYVNDFTKSEEVLLKLKSEYPKNYKIYLRLSMLYIDMQADKEDEDKDYSKAVENYNTAKNFYKQHEINGESDGEMQALEDMINTLKEQEWIQ